MQKTQALQLTVPGMNHPLVLSGGSQGESLRKREDLWGKEIRVTGKLLVKNTDQLLELTVESFQPKGK